MSNSRFPTPQEADRVMRYRRAGITIDRIARILGMPKKDLEEVYPFECGFTDDEDLACVADVAFMMASNGQHPAMTKWWLQVKGGWLFDEGRLPEDYEPLILVMDPQGVRQISSQEPVPVFEPGHDFDHEAMKKAQDIAEAEFKEMD